MKIQKSLYLLITILFFTGCEVKMGPSQFWSKLFRTQTDSKYYMGKTENLVKILTEDVAEYEINKVTVFDLVDEENKTAGNNNMEQHTHEHCKCFNVHDSRFVLGTRRHTQKTNI